MASQIVIAIVLFILALAIILTSSYFLVEALLSVANRVKLSMLVVGSLVLAAGNSLPEFATALISNLKGLAELGAGAVIASPYMNLALVIGIVAIFSSAKLEDKVERKLITFAIMPPLLLSIVAYNGTISRFEGILLLSVYVAYQLYIYLKGVSIGKEIRFAEVALHYAAIPIAVIGLVIASFLLVDTGEFIADAFSIPTAIVGLVIISTCTVAPDLAAGIAGIIKKQASIGLGDVLGANAFNFLFVFGMVSLIKPMVFNFAAFKFSLIITLCTMGMFIMYACVFKRIDKWIGFALIGSYVVFLCVNLL